MQTGRNVLRYSFHPVDACNLCGASASNFQVLGKRLNSSQGRQPKQKTGISVSVVRCISCGLVFSNPQPIPADLQDHYGIPPESYWGEDYFTVRDDYFATEIETLKKLQPFSEGARVLDVGAGIGKAMIALQKAGYDAYGFEPSVPFHERAISRMNISPDKLQLGAIETVDYPADFFDFVSFGAVLEHLYDPSAALVKSLQWLKPGGFIHVEVPSSKWFVNKILNYYYRLRGLDYVANISPMHNPYHLYEFTLRSFEMHAQKHNYTVADHEVQVCKSYLPKALDVLARPYMKRTKTGMQLIVWLQKNSK